MLLLIPVSGVQEGQPHLPVCVEVQIEGNSTSTCGAELDERKDCGIVLREETVELETSVRVRRVSRTVDESSDQIQAVLVLSEKDR